MSQNKEEEEASKSKSLAVKAKNIADKPGSGVKSSQSNAESQSRIKKPEISNTHEVLPAHTTDHSLKSKLSKNDNASGIRVEVRTIGVEVPHYILQRVAGHEKGCLRR